MFALQQFIDRSLISRRRLMPARHFYSPSATGLPAQSAFARWAQRVSEQSELVVSRELAGLSEPELNELETEFARCPFRQPATWVRTAVIGGVALIAFAALALGLQAFSSLGEGAGRTLQTASVVVLLIGLLAVGAGQIAAFGSIHLDVCHGTTGLYVGKLDEQHPWLYAALRLTIHGVAEDYRQRTLRERGSLRGADYIMMRELVQAQESSEGVRPARSVAEQLQSLPVIAPPKATEPRLVRVGAARDGGSSPEADVSRQANS